MSLNFDPKIMAPKPVYQDALKFTPPPRMGQVRIRNGMQEVYTITPEGEVSWKVVGPAPVKQPQEPIIKKKMLWLGDILKV